MKLKEINNIAFIDGQNLYSGTKDDGWKVDLKKFRIYLRDKYKVKEAYYFLGCVSEEEQSLYKNLQKAGFIIIFKEHSTGMLAHKKGNVDTDIVFEIMRNLIDNKDMDKVVIVSGDGDYKKITDYLIEKDRFEKILFPNKRFASSLYFQLKAKTFDYLDNFKTYIRWYRNEKGS